MNKNLNIVESENHKYVIEPVVGISSRSDERRAFYRVVKDDDKVHYKSYAFTESRIRVELNKGNSYENIFSAGEDIIEKYLLLDNDQNMEFVFSSNRNFIRDLNDFGEYKK